MKRCTSSVALVFLAPVLLVASVFANAPQLVNYQGRLTDAGGQPVADGPYNLDLRIYATPTGGSSLWHETHTGVPVTGGQFSILLGSVNTPSVELADSVFTDTSRWLGVTVNGGSEMTPRLRLSTVPYAFRVATIDGATGGTIGTGIFLGRDSLTADTVESSIESSTQFGVAAPIPCYRTEYRDLETLGTKDGESYGTLTLRDGEKTTIALHGCSGNLEASGSAMFGPYHTATGTVTSCLVAGSGHSVVGQGLLVVGRSNTVQSSYSVCGGEDNSISGYGCFIGGGSGNLAAEHGSVVAGGEQNTAYNFYSVVGGGKYNIASGMLSVVAGGGSEGADIGGVGDGNVAVGDFSFVGGGSGNWASGRFSVVGGGGGEWFQDMNDNRICNVADGVFSAVVGGKRNSAVDSGSFIGGGEYNHVTASDGVISGGFADTVSGVWGTVPGGAYNKAAGVASFAAGQSAKALNNNCFVWNDGSAGDFASTGASQFLVRAAGGTGIGTNSPKATLHVEGSLALNVSTVLFSGGTLGNTSCIVLVPSTLGAMTVNLPDATTCADRVYTIKRTGSFGVTVDASGSQTIDGAATYSLSALYKYVTIVASGGAWYIIANN